MSNKRSGSPSSENVKPEKKKSKKPLEAVLNPHYQLDDVKKEIQKQWFGKESSLGGGAQVLTEPFPCCSLENFIDGESFLECLRNELLNQEFDSKINDLYQFKNTADLKNALTPYIKALQRFLYKDFLEWLKDVTKIPLTEEIDMNCAQYDYTDVLLCHDDELEGRRIAYILYLVPPWSAEDGGTLDLFSRDENGQPDIVVESIVPAWNKFAFFEVTPISFHQVSEVLSQEKCRLSISGWFHGPPVPRPSPWKELPPVSRSPGWIEENLIYDWINPSYVDPESQAIIAKSFEDESQVRLYNFLTADKYEAVCQALRNSNIQWTRRGPANRRSYEVASEHDVETDEILKTCTKLLSSEAFFLLLSQLTSLCLHSLAAKNSEDSSSGSDIRTRSDNESEPATCSWEWQQWQHKSYTLLHDLDSNSERDSLDCILYFNCDNWKIEHGGYISYVAKDEDEELLTVHPESNTLTLVFRDIDTLRFVKYGNDRMKEMGESFQSLHIVYHE